MPLQLSTRPEAYKVDQMIFLSHYYNNIVGFLLYIICTSFDLNLFLFESSIYIVINVESSSDDLDKGN